MSESCLTPYHDEIKTLLPLVGRVVLARRYHVSEDTVRYYARTRGLWPYGRTEPCSFLDCYHDEIVALYRLCGARALAARYACSVPTILWWIRSRGLAGRQGQRAARWNTYESRWIR